MFSLIYAWINDWANNREAGDLRRQYGHYDVIIMGRPCPWQMKQGMYYWKHFTSSFTWHNFYKSALFSISLDLTDYIIQTACEYNTVGMTAIQHFPPKRLTFVYHIVIFCYITITYIFSGLLHRRGGNRMMMPVSYTRFKDIILTFIGMSYKCYFSYTTGGEYRRE